MSSPARDRPAQDRSADAPAVEGRPAARAANEPAAARPSLSRRLPRLESAASRESAPLLTAHRAHLIGCRSCGRVWPEGTLTCGRCGAALVPPDRRSLQAVWAWLAAGIILYVPANLLPMMKTQTMMGLKGSVEATIIGGVIELYRYGSWGVASIILVASVFIPIAKFGAIAWLAVVAGRPATMRAAHRRLVLFEVIEYIGRWSMIDVFVVAILSALVQLGFVATIHPGLAAVSFALSVAFTMLSAQSFDPRLIWRGLPLQTRSDRTDR